MTRWLTLAAVLFALGLGVLGCGGDDEGGDESRAASASTTVRIGVLRGNTPLDLVKDDGSLARALEPLGAEVRWAGPFPAFAPAAEALNADSIDITVGSITSAVGALAGQSNFTIFARQLAADTEAIIVGRDSGVEAAADLKGKKVAVNRGGTGEYLLLKALDGAGVPIDAVERVYLAPPEAAAAFESGEVDAWATWSVFTTLAQTQYGGKLLATGTQLGSENDVVFLVRTAFLDEHPELVKAVFDRLEARAQEAAADREGTVELVTELLDVPPEMASNISDTAWASVDPIDAPIVQRFQGIADYFAEKEVLPAQVSLAGNTIDVNELSDRVE